MTGMDNISSDHNNPAYAILLEDLIEQLLSRLESEEDCASYITTQIRELVGVRLVALVSHIPDHVDPAHHTHLLAGLCPARLHHVTELDAFSELVDELCASTSPGLIRPGEGKAGDCLDRLGMGTSFAFPLLLGDERLGVLLLLGLLDERGTFAILHAISRVSRVIALILKNANLYRGMRNTVQLKTRQLSESERLFGQLFEQIGDGVAILSVDGEILQTNSALGGLLNRSHEEIQDLGLKGLDVEGDSKLKERIGILSSGRSLQFEAEYLHKDGRTIPFEISATMVNIDGVVRVLAIFRDITERKRAEKRLILFNQELETRVQERTAELAEANRELAVANRELESFAYSVSHDLRAPLRSINGFSGILQQRYEAAMPAEASRYMDKIRAATVRMGQLIDDLLSLSRLSRQELVIKPLDLGSIAKSVIADLVLENPERQVEFVAEGDLRARGDPSLVRVVLENLLRNAWKFTSRKDSARIELGHSAMEVTPGLVGFFVGDNGAGFDQAYVAKLFLPFQRLHAMHDFPGTGIGLAIVQRVIHRHGGVVSARGEVSRGASFHFSLPKA